MQYNRHELLSIGKNARRFLWPNNLTFFARLKQLGIFKYRGVRGGICKFNPISKVNNGINLNNLQLLPQHIPTIVRPRSTEVFQNADTSKLDDIFKHSDIFKNADINNQNFKTNVQIKCESINVVKGQKNIKVCCINPRSVKNKTLALSDFI